MAETHKLRTNAILPKTAQFQTWNQQAEALAKTVLQSNSNANNNNNSSSHSNSNSHSSNSSNSLPMPSLDHLRMADYDRVYEPSDDTYLMLDALSCHFHDDTIAENGVENGVENHCKGGSATTPFVLAVSPQKLSFSGIFVSKFFFLYKWKFSVSFQSLGQNCSKGQAFFCLK